MTGRFIGTLLILSVVHGEVPGRLPRAQVVSTAGATLDQLLAPVALYPDQLLAQILMSAADPPKVVEFDRWLKANQDLKGTKLQDAAMADGFDPSLVALAQFPQVVTRMALQIDWTNDVGAAFAANKTAVFDAIQRLRKQAQSVGTLKTTAQQEVETRTTSAGQQVIVIEPANPQVVYVPQYNPTVVYTQPPTTTTVVVQQDDDDAAEAVAAGLIGFTAGIAIGAAMDNNYYYGPYGWRGGAYMYNDAWDDYYDAREDAREDWMDHREDVVEERSDVAQNRQEQRTERVESTQQQRTERAQSGATAQTQAATQSRTNRTGSTEARGYSSSSSTSSSSSQRATQRSSGSGAFSGYSSGKSTQAASSRGNRSQSSARSGGGRRK
jgi:hypothetical protein